MALKSLEEHALGLTWVMAEPLQRASHALRADDGRVWLVDPVDEPDALARAAALGPAAAVLQLLDRHARDGAALAARLGVPHLAMPGGVGDAPFAFVPLVGRGRWKEIALWWPQRRALVVAETLGTTPLFTAGAGAVGVHIALRLAPPRVLGGFDAEHLLVGHGAPLHGPHVGGEVRRALERSRRDLPRAIAMLPATARRLAPTS